MTPDIVVRRVSFDLSDLPDDWVGGGRIATWFGNAGHVFIPLGEQFFIDTVRQFRDRIPDELQRQVNAFIGQEATHKRAHAKVWDTLRSRGVPIDRYCDVIAAVRTLEPHLPATFRLSVTAALEHYTAAFGLTFLTEDLDSVLPAEMARLLAWHGLEELEHRSVAFDVLQTVDDRYSVRVAGFAFATGLFIVVPTAGTMLFGAADLGRTTPHDDRNSGLAPIVSRFGAVMGRHLLSYLRPDFHPSELPLPPQAETLAVALDQEAGRGA